ncbi:fam-a protein [Plasmodium vinckei lentum]|uniref:Fam-a protein n=1 Tax=Plasmodium vinckei lentum TaxID=138297 RepID=A0A6V7S9M1_PLAVN|nr:fam-a protein [Plasmodium vinckei lentum]
MLTSVILKMKVISVGLISLIIFNIVLAKNTPDSGTTTNSFQSCTKKTKKIHKTTDRPVNVKCNGTNDSDFPDIQFIDEFDPMLMEIYKGNQTELDKSIISETNGAIVNKGTGFLRSENESRKKGWYIRPYEENYEEDYEDMIKDIFMPLKNNHQHNKNNSYKQDDAPPPVSKGPKKQKFTEKRQLRTINENDEIFQKFTDLLFTDPEEDTKKKEKTKTESKKRYATPEEIYEEKKKLLCTDPKEITNAIKLMNEAATHLDHHATSKDDYELCKYNRYYNRTFSRKKHGDTDVQRINCRYLNPSKYNAIINVLWDPALANGFNPGSVKRKIVRVYNPNLVMIQQRYKSGFRGREKYFYALAAKVDISEDKTIIVMTSPNINDHHPSEKEYKNTIIENANLFKFDIDSEDDIRKGRWEKTFVNIAGYLIEKTRARVDITYLESIDGHTSNFNKLFIEKALIKLLH